MTETTDVVIIGGGPAGSSAGAFLARHARRVILMERERFPRHHVGESTLQGLFGMLDQEIGVGEKLKEAHFRIKTGGSFIWGTNRTPWTFRFTDSADPDNIDQLGFEVERDTFDQILLDHSRDLGVDVREEVSVNSIIESEGGVRGVRCCDAQGRRYDIECKYVIDASGLGSILGRQLGIRRNYEQVRNFAIYGYWDCNSLPYTALGGDITESDSSNIVIIRANKYWVWFIPLRERVSVGIVSEMGQMREVKQGGIAEYYEKCIADCPEVALLLENVRFLAKEPLRTVQDWSHICDRLCGRGYFLAGDAAAFVDPILSSGVHLAVTFGLNCGRSVNTLLSYPENRADWVYDWYGAAYRISYEDFRRMADAWYLGSGGSDDWFEVARERVQEGLAEELSKSQAFVRIASGTLTSGSFRDRICHVDLNARVPRVYFSPVTNRFSYTVDARETMAKYLENFPSAMIPAVFEGYPSAAVKPCGSSAPITPQTRPLLSADVRLGFFSERGRPVLDAAAYLASANNALQLGMYAPLHPLLIEVLESLDGRRSVEEIAAGISAEPHSLVGYLSTLSQAGFLDTQDPVA